MVTPTSLPTLVLIILGGYPEKGKGFSLKEGGDRNVALVSSFVDVELLEGFLNASEWEFVVDTPLPDPAILSSVSAVVESSISNLRYTKNATLYQYLYTGFNDSDLNTIPSHFYVANVHQSEISIAEYVISAALHWNINIPKMDSEFRGCTWRSSPPGNTCHRLGPHKELNGQTIGIIGYGHIGEGIAIRAAAFGMKVVATTLHPPATPPSPLQWLKDDSANPELMSVSDFVVIACPLTSSTQGLVNTTLLKHMSQTAVIINIARGPIIEELALYNALKNKQIGGAVLDVWWHSLAWYNTGRTGPASWPSAYRFDKLDNVIMTPHSSSLTAQAHLEAYREGAANLDALATGRSLDNVVRNRTDV